MAFIYTSSVAQHVTSVNGISHSLQATGDRDSHYLNIAFTVDTGTCGTNITSLVSSIELHHIYAVCSKLYGMRYSKQVSIAITIAINTVISNNIARYVIN